MDQVLMAVSHGELVMDATTAMDIILEVAHGLRHAHSIVRPEGKIVHGHLEPSQVILTAEGDIRILGIGVTPAEIDPRYMPQELASRTGLDERTDQWQIGALLYELITRQPLYKGAWSEARRASGLGDVTPQLDRLEGKHPALTQVLRKMLATQPSSRYQVESTFLRALLTASRSVSGRSRRRVLGAEAARIEPIKRPDRPESAPARNTGCSGWSRVGPDAEASGPLIFDPGDTGEQSDYELAEQMATDAGAVDQSWVDLPDGDRTPLPDLFARPKPAIIRLPSARAPVPSGPPQLAAVNRPRAPVRRPGPILAAVSAPEPNEGMEVQVLDSLSLRSDTVTIRTAADLPDERVDDLRAIIGGGPPAGPRAGASVRLAVLRVAPTAEPSEPSEAPVPTPSAPSDGREAISPLEVPDHPLRPDLAPTVFALRPPEFEPTMLMSGREQVKIDRDLVDTPTDPGFRLPRTLLSDPPTELLVPKDAFGIGNMPVSRDPLPELEPDSPPAPFSADRLQWGMFLALSVMGFLTLWALIFVG
jgi:hypothetical protein